MRLGAYPCVITPGSRAYHCYGEFEISERHRHRFEVNNAYRTAFEEAGVVFSGTSPDGELVEMLELPAHPFFLAVQFHPELKSRPRRPHPLFREFVGAAVARQERLRDEASGRTPTPRGAGGEGAETAPAASDPRARNEETAAG